ncbi:MAG: SDR family NAD(P)-dependent oxidoreductase [Butyrivibrio sp.]|nr:SDR family NAD(P)-dependent oxidoreductase [Butyrivibrio sp.]
MKRIVLITGSSDGIGRETAIKFAEMGYFVILNCKNSPDKLIKLEGEIKLLGGDCLSFQKDVSQFNEVSEIFAILEKNQLIPDIIINNAAISYVGLLQDMSVDEWNNIVSTNLNSCFYTSKLAIPHMLNKGGGKIINISSMWGSVGASCEVAYSATKGGVNSFTRALAKELAPSRIQVNAVAFGVVDTRMNGFLSEQERAALIEEIPAGRFCSPREAAAIIYKVSQLDDYITGQVITADGGMI